MTIVHKINSVIIFLSLIAHTPLIITCLHILLRPIIHMQSQRFRFIQQMSKWGADVIAKIKIKYSQYIYCALTQSFSCGLNSLLQQCTLFLDFYQTFENIYEHDILWQKQPPKKKTDMLYFSLLLNLIFTWYLFYLKT